MNLMQRYSINCLQRTDINEHLPVLRFYASQVAHVTEFGVRAGCSTSAFAVASPATLICYDINPMDEDYRKQLNEHIINFKFIQKSTLDVEIEETDLLFIDTYHSYDQLKKELQLHKNKVHRFLIFHDTESFGLVGEDKKSPGLIQAIEEETKDFFPIKKLPNNNGLWVMERV